ncbi:MAG TPA: RNA polymerase subunit sigma [Citreicella sp.]|jgi:RNA polymerase sigma-70 factor, ECF subfamily|nr:sigma-70 family RNA polymerase sigma factor [Salipiger manganoxidans]HBM60835.1 RNA polymerase subunit sigma [Citreicella sp.]HBT00976.1 RNA polymerase subunit sigma [Citreicella sp.]|tara:strand:+ start:99 stop:779 length:681 start_codon:yes stop_codon:yes gene_type:complete
MSLDATLTDHAPVGHSAADLHVGQRAGETRTRTLARKGGTVTTPDGFTEPTQWLIAVRDRRDRAAFARLFDHFGPRLKAMLLRGGLRDGSAEDVVQDVMLAVWHKAAQFDPHRAEASAWIYRIARNRQIDLVRRRPAVVLEELEEPPGNEPDAPQILALAQEARHLRAALDRLAPEQVQAIQKAYMEDMPHSEISRTTGLPLGTIKSRIRLGLERLRHELKDLKPE